MSPSSRTELLPIGVIARAHGVRGMVRVRTYAPTSDALADVARVFVGEPAREYRVESAQPERDAWLMKLEGLSDRDQADALRGQELLVVRSELPAIDDDEVYVRDLVGCEVVDTAGALLGHVTGVQGGAQELLVIARASVSPGTGDKPLELLIPFVEPIVVAVDIVARRIVCDPPEGLVDLEPGGKP